MANSKHSAVTPMPFPGESPTVALAMAAAQKYGLHEEDEKPAKKARPTRAAAKKAVAKKAPAKRKSPARTTKKKAKTR